MKICDWHEQYFGIPLVMQDGPGPAIHSVCKDCMAIMKKEIASYKKPKVERRFNKDGLLLLLLFLLSVALTLTIAFSLVVKVRKAYAEEPFKEEKATNVYDENYKLKFRINEGKIYDENQKLKGYIDGSKFYNENFQYKGKVGSHPGRRGK